MASSHHIDGMLMASSHRWSADGQQRPRRSANSELHKARLARLATLSWMLVIDLDLRFLLFAVWRCTELGQRSIIASQITDIGTSPGAEL